MSRSQDTPGAALLSRPARADDLTAIMSLETAAFTGGWSAASWAEEIAHQRVTVFVAAAAPASSGLVDPGQLAGVSAWSLVAGTAELRRVVVAPAWRRRGVGRRLVSDGLAWAQAAGATEVFLEVSGANLPARQLYAALGFVVIDRRADYYGPGDDALVCRRRFGAPAPLSLQPEEETCLNH